MAVMRWRPVSQGLEPWVGASELGDIQTEVNRLFGTFFGRSAQAGPSERSWAPAADMYETKDELVIKADLPGMSDKDVQVSITGDLLSLKGKRVESEVVQPERLHRLHHSYAQQHHSTVAATFTDREQHVRYRRGHL